MRLPSWGRWPQNLLPRLRRYLLLALGVITTLAVFVPFNAGMPAEGVDPSWMMAMNEAVARRLRIGSDVVFTFGPYSSVYSRAYHPGTDHLMVIGCLLLAAAYLTGLLYLDRGKKPYLLFMVLLVLTSFVSTLYFTRDSLFFSYPLLLVLCVSKYSRPDGPHASSLPPRWSAFLLALGFAALGLLPLVKGSLLVPSSAIALVSTALLLHRLRSPWGFVPLLISVVACVIFWSAAGQSLHDLLPFLANTLSLTFGYTEAMGATALLPAYDLGSASFFAIVAMLLFYSLVRTSAVDGATRLALGVSLVVFLVVVFKAGFVRCDQWHIVTSFGSIVIVALLVCFLYADRYLVGAAVVSSLVVAGISVRFDPILSAAVVKEFGEGTASAGRRHLEILSFVLPRAPGAFLRITYERTRNTFVDAWGGLRMRLADGPTMRHRFDSALADISTRYGVPPLPGTADLYSFDQIVLLASHTEWKPRPVFQSFAAYSGGLARLNENHLRAASAPDNVLIRLRTIDGRVPLLDDGPSWLALLDNYTVLSKDARLAYLRKKPAVRTSSDLQLIHEGTHATGATVPLPGAAGPVYATVDLQLTMLGRLLTAVFRPPQLRITLQLADGTSASHRVVASMMASGFIVSPYVRSTDDFVLLATGDEGFQRSAAVESISVAPVSGGPLFWSGTYNLKLSAYRRTPSSIGAGGEAGTPTSSSSAPSLNVDTRSREHDARRK